MSYFKIIKNEFKNYSLNSFCKDALAGITCTAVALPLALAFGVSSGADAASGLICAIIAGLVIGALSGASYQISGPTGAMAAILISLSASYGMKGIFVATFLSGLLLLLFAVLRVGRLVYFIPKPVITGFTSGIAIIIALGQIDNAFGTHSSGTSALEKLYSYTSLGFHPSLIVVAMTLLSMAIMILWPKRLNKIVPGSLLAIIICLIVELIFSFDIPLVGAIPRTLILSDRLKLSSLFSKEILSFISPAISIALLGMIESLLCGASGSKMKNEKFDSTQELIAQGVGNILIPFFGGIPATAAIARTSVAIKSGGQTRVVSIIHSLGLILSMFLLGPLMARIPLSALAGVLMVTAWKMNEWEGIKVVFRTKTSAALFLATMASTVVFDLTMAILVGAALAIALFLIKIIRDTQFHSEEHDNEVTITIHGPLFFGTAERLRRTVEEAIEEGKTVHLSLEHTSLVDISGAEEINSLIADYRLRVSHMDKHNIFKRLSHNK